MASKILSIPRHGGNGSDGSDSYRSFCKREARRAMRRQGREMVRGIDKVAFLGPWLERAEAPTKYQLAGYAD